MNKNKIFISLTGMSGSGKTTLFNNLILCLYFGFQNV